MPIYTYSCDACSGVVEKRQSFSDEPLRTCEQCGGSLRRVIHPVGIVFKGSGWYVTDSRSSAGSSDGAGKQGESAAGSSPPASPDAPASASATPAGTTAPA